MAAACANRAACAQAFPVIEQHRLIWVWPDDSPSRFEDSARQPVAQAVPFGPAQMQQEGWTEVVPQFAREFAYSYETLFDNALDPTHVPWAHHGVLGRREHVQPIVMEVVRDLSPEVRYAVGGSTHASGLACSLTSLTRVQMLLAAAACWSLSQAAGDQTSVPTH